MRLLTGALFLASIDIANARNSDGMCLDNLEVGCQNRFIRFPQMQL